MITLVSWNVRYFSQGARGLGSTKKGVLRASEALAALDDIPDVLALQEVDNESLRSRAGREAGQSLIESFLETLNRLCEPRGVRYQGLFYKAQGADSGLRVLSTGLAVIYREGLYVTHHNADDPHDITHRRITALKHFKQKRICAHAKFKNESGEALDLFNTHLSLPAFLKPAGGNTGKRFGEAINQVKEIETVLDFIKDRGDPARSVLVGDFNARPGSLVYEAVLNRGGLKDLFAHHHGMDLDTLNTLTTAGFANAKFRLDHIFAGQGIGASHFAHVHPYGPEHPFEGLSDHMPIIVRLSDA